VRIIGFPSIKTVQLPSICSGSFGIMAFTYPVVPSGPLTVNTNSEFVLLNVKAVTVLFDLTPENIADFGVYGYKDMKKHLDPRRKIDWIKKYYPKGLRIKALLSKKGGYQGMFEYLLGKYAHRPVNA